MESISVIFMIKPNHHLEWQAILLAASWRYHFADKVSLHAFIEAKELSQLPEESKEKLYSLGVKIRPMHVEGVFASKYPHGNKILASMQEFDSDRIIFCDSDVYIHRHFDLNSLCQGVVSAVPAGAKTWGDKKGESWEYLYRQYLGIDVPDSILLENNRESAPYYNAGLISFKSDSGFAKNWFDISRLIDNDDNVANKRPWLDQIALPLAIKKTCIETNQHFDELDKLYNCTPSFNDKGFETPYIIHYHRIRKIYQNTLNDEVSRQLAETNTTNNFMALTRPIRTRIDAG